MGVSVEVLTRVECSLLAAVLYERDIRAAARDVGMASASASRLIRRLELTNGTKLVVDDAGVSKLTSPGRVLLHASLKLYDRPEQAADINIPEGHELIRIASCLDTAFEVDELARHNPPLVPDVIETDIEHAFDLFDGGCSDAVVTWDLPGLRKPSRATVAVPLFHEDLLVVGRNIPEKATTVENLPEDIKWATTSKQVALLRTTIDAPEDSSRLLVFESPQAVRVLILAGTAAGVVLASQLDYYVGHDLRQVSPVSLTAMLYIDRRCGAHNWIPQIQGMFRNRHRRMSYTSHVEHAPDRSLSGYTGHLEVGDAKLLRAIQLHGSLNRAASELCLTQPALTRRVRKLEERVGVHLVLRTSAGSVLSADAASFVDRVDAALKLFQADVSAGLASLTRGCSARPAG